MSKENEIIDNDLDEEDDNDSYVTLYSQGYDSSPMLIEPGNLFIMPEGYEGAVASSCNINLGKDEQYSSEELDTLTSGKYYYTGREIRHDKKFRMI